MDTVKVREVGNSATITIPRSVLRQSSIKIGDSVTLVLQSDGGISLNKAPDRELDEVEKYLEKYYGKPIGEIGVIESEEIDWGPDVGEEVLDEY